MAELHHLQPFKRSQQNRKRVGRGLGSGHGAYSTRGVKGQRARSGGKKGLKARAIKQMVRRISKLSGFKSIHPKSLAINVALLETHFTSSEKVTPDSIVKKGILKVPKGKRNLSIKILGDGALTKSLTIQGCLVSASAKEKIEKAGGTIHIER